MANPFFPQTYVDYPEPPEGGYEDISNYTDLQVLGYIIEEIGLMLEKQFKYMAVDNKLKAALTNAVEHKIMNLKFTYGNRIQFIFDNISFKALIKRSNSGNEDTCELSIVHRTPLGLELLRNLNNATTG
jgi:hypothetical protein